MTRTSLLKIVCTMVAIGAATGPAIALDYEAKPVNWVIKAPFRLIGGLAGGLAGGVATGGVSEPISDSYHWALKGTQHVAGKFGDKNGQAQLVCAAPLGGSVGFVLGAAHGVPYGFFQGFKKGWDKPFSRWSFLATGDEEKK